MTLDVALGAGAEFEAVREIVTRTGGVARGVGDDAAVLRLARGDRLVVSVDAAIEGVHFRRDWLTPREIGWRAAAAALSDLAAMGATPVGALLALVLPAEWRSDVGELAEGFGEALRFAGAALVGGNTARGERLSLTTTVLGQAYAPVGRWGARPGDGVYVTGRLGGPAAALASLREGTPVPAEQRARFARPLPRLAEGRWLAAAGATAMIDVSDGLAADLGHVAAASGMRIVLELERIPALDGIFPALAAASGEEYELAVTSSLALDVDAFLERFGVLLTRVGHVEAAHHGDAGLETRSGGRRVAPPAGHDHLTR